MDRRNRKSDPLGHPKRNEPLTTELSIPQPISAFTNQSTGNLRKSLPMTEAPRSTSLVETQVNMIAVRPNLNTNPPRTLQVSYTSLPKINVTVNGKPLSGLVDTGAGISIIGKHVTDLENVENPPAVVSITGVNGEIIEPIGTTSANILLPTVSESTTHEFWIIDLGPTPAQDVIVGIDLLKKVGLSYDVVNDCLFSTQKTKPRFPVEIDRKVLTVNCQREVKLPARTEVILITELPHEHELVTASPTFMAEGSGSLPFPVFCARVVNNLDKRKRFPLKLMNTANCDITLRKNQEVALLYPVAEDKICTFSARQDNKVATSSFREEVEKITEDFNLDHLTEGQRRKMEYLIKKYSHIFARSLNELGRYNGKPISIDTGNSPPISSRPYRVPQSQEQILEDKVKELLDAGIIYPSNSSWCAPCVLVTQVRNGEKKIRLCHDFRRLNQVIRPSHHPLPSIRECLDRLNNATFLSTLDQTAGYLQIRVAEEDQPKTSFITPTGVYSYRTMPFGLCNAPSDYQRTMQIVLSGLIGSCVLVYLDDTLVYTSASFDDHLVHLAQVFECYSKANLKLKPNKCQLAHRQVKFLGHVIGKGQIKPIEEKLKAVKEFPQPTDINSLREFLGLTAYYKSFIPSLASIAQPLYQLLRKDVKWYWGSSHQQSFDSLKDILCSDPVLRMPDFSKPMILSCDASTSGLGVVLEQDFDGARHPIAYSSRTLTPAEKNYSITELEALAVVYGTQIFRYYLYGRPFEIVTDHSALRYILTNKSGSGRLTRWALKLSEFDFTITHRAGKKQRHVDALSRNAMPVSSVSIVSTATSPLDWESLKREQVQDNVFGPIIAYIKGKTRLPKGISDLDQFVFEENEVLYHISQNHGNNEPSLQICLPYRWRRDILRSYHDSLMAGHMGFATTYQKIKREFFWINMYSDIKQYVLSCDSCQKFNHRPGLKKAEMGEFEIPTDRFEFISIDILGPFVSSHKGNRYCLVIIDLFTRWPEVIPIRDQTASTVTKAFVNEYVTRHSLPNRVISDLGSQFISNLFVSVMEYMQIKVSHSLPYFHKTTGTVERLNQSIEQIICHFTNTSPFDWDEYIPMALFALRTAVHSSTNHSPFYLTYIRDPLLPFEKFLAPFNLRYFPKEDYLQRLMMESQTAFQRTQEFMQTQAEKRKTRYDRDVQPQSFAEGQVVYIKDFAPHPGKMSKLKAAFKGPYRITRKLSDRRYLAKPIYKPNKAEKEFHHDHMRKGYLPVPYPSLNELEDGEPESLTPIARQDRNQSTQLQETPDVDEEDSSSDEEIGLPTFTPRPVRTRIEIPPVDRALRSKGPIPYPPPDLPPWRRVQQPRPKANPDFSEGHPEASSPSPPRQSTLLDRIDQALS